MTRKPPPPRPPCSIEGDLDVFSVHQQWERLLPMLTPLAAPLAGEEKAGLPLDVSALGDLDLSGVQLLCALERDLKAKGIQLSLSGVKPEWQARFAPLGLAALFGGEPS